MLRTRFIVLLLCAVIINACSLGEDTVRPRQAPFDPYASQSAGHAQTIPTYKGDDQSIMQDSAYQPPMGQTARGKVAILLPLSGSHSVIGQAMLQAAQLALFDLNEQSVELIPVDTRGTPSGATQATHEAATQGATVILGPLLANSVAAAGRAATQHNLNVIGFTTDWTKAGNNIFTIGILPFDQGTRLAQYASGKGVKRIAILNPNDAYATAAVSAFENAARPLGIETAHNVLLKADGSNAASIAMQLAAARNTFDAILIPAGNPGMNAIADALSKAGLSAQNILWMGTGLWDDPSIKQIPAMAGAVYAAPSPDLRRNFETNYRSLYGQQPPRLASLAYDATALSIILLRQGETISKNAIMNPNGFAGIDGIFRLQSNGLAQRGLAVHKITSRGNAAIVDQAPNSFLTNVGDFPPR